MSEPVLGILKGCLLALLYLFLLRVVIVVGSELKGTPQPAGPQPNPLPEPAPTAPRAVNNQGSQNSTATWRATVIAPPEYSGTVEVHGEVTIGRGGGCAISVPTDTFVSTVHARIYQQNNELWLEDLGSTNGTRLNDEPIKRATRLQSGDHVGVGSTIIEVQQ